jgi:hypothetical protein
MAGYPVVEKKIFMVEKIAQTKLSEMRLFGLRERARGYKEIARERKRKREKDERKT